MNAYSQWAIVIGFFALFVSVPFIPIVFGPAWIECRKVAVLWLLERALDIAPGKEAKGLLAKHVQAYLLEDMIR